jgi:signal peptide peptidase SppA
MKRKLHFILTRIFDTPLMIQRQKLDTVLAVLRPRLPMMFEGDYPDGTPVEEEASHDPLDVDARVAIIPVHGVLVHRATGMDAMCGMTDYQVLTRMVNEAADSADVDAILLEIDSPGGEAHGCFEFADAIFEARSKKPIVALVNEMACSAAYAIASAAHSIYVTKTALVGSIGVIATHVDVSKADEMAGYKYTHIFAGKKKADWTEHEPLSERGKAALQQQVTSMYNIFVSTVARNRGIEPESIAGTEAGLFMGKSGVVAGLADEVIPLSALSEKLQEAIMAKQVKPTPAATANKGPANSAANPAANANLPIIAGESTPPTDDTDDEDEDEEDTTPPTKESNPAPTQAPATNPTPAPQQAAAFDAEAAAEISNICTVAGKPALAAGFIKQKLTVQQAKAKLFDELANQGGPSISAVAPISNMEEDEATTLLVAGMQRLNEQNSRARRR